MKDDDFKAIVFVGLLSGLIACGLMGIIFFISFGFIANEAINTTVQQLHEMKVVCTEDVYPWAAMIQFEDSTLYCTLERQILSDAPETFLVSRGLEKIERQESGTFVLPPASGSDVNQ